MRKKGRTRGWELLLSYSPRENMTTGFVKGTEYSETVEAVNHLSYALIRSRIPCSCQ